MKVRKLKMSKVTSCTCYLFILMLVLAVIPACKKNTNNPPDIPVLISPDNGLLGTYSDTLKWSCSDPDGDELVYDIYFSKSNPPTFAKPNYKSKSIVFNDLDLDATYYFYVVAKDPSGGSSKSSISSLKVVYDLPAITTADSYGTSVSSAISGGKVTSQGNIVITSKGVCWSTEHNPVIEDNKTNDGTGMDPFVSTITELSPSTVYYARAYATNAIGTSYGAEVVFRTFSGTMSDIDGNIYNTIIIGNQEWMVGNLNVSRYRNGDPLPEISDNNTWQNTSAGAYCFFDNNNGNSTIYGRIYNWYAVIDNRNIAPAGWHVPGIEEWTELVNSAGGEIVAGGRLKHAGTAAWNSPNDGATNETGFTALPGGFRDDTGIFSGGPGFHGAWWTSSEQDLQFAFGQFMYNSSTQVHGEPDPKNRGFSIRCVKD